MAPAFDPVTLEILWSRLIAVADESATTLLRTAFTPIIRESNDFATCLMTVDGEALAECSGGIPAFAGLLARAAQHILRKFPHEVWQEGDCVFTNDPWIATGHLPDVAMIAPIFFRGRLVGFSGTVAHTPDIGGRQGADNRELFEEGVCIPPLHLYRAGDRCEEMLALFLENVRQPDLLLGDLEAQVTANAVCRRRAVAFLEEAGLEDFEALARAIHGMSERAMRTAIASLPDGEYHSEIELDGFPDHPTRICCTVTIEGDAMTVDYAGSSKQNGRATNCTLNYTHAYSIYPLKCVLDPDTRRNEGSYRPIRVTAPEGSVLNAARPAAVNARHLSGHALSCALYQALAEILPDRVLADSGGAPALRAGIVGRSDAGDPFTMILFASAGMGASAHGDGLATTAFPTNSGAGSLEVLEAGAPVLFKRKQLRVDSGGAGKYRGGLGQVCEIENIASQTVYVTIIGEREKHPARGVLGGQPGACASASVGGLGAVSLKSRSPLKPGASVTFHFAGGGGFGDPAERDPAAVATDMRLGLVSEDAARRDYPQVAGGGA
ncbi:hydantoinase B/oxoprolinase family protein [Stakelama tenebrarum]|uniref:Hydantoinase B/oxoprolinase family protein n=1 Tax=Stakelama tenebrarum TaxID=2711215 RepID=A0A6G6Y1H0_9SPHN|nr:hydantoinase B/oxoprolinase family protein [Sphingosinithalassobacter tenebrarum]QIG78772.1 hydantoinase B/oxoprolinase family protein [Sphingosinithalassobacter tenebrarum]